MKNLEHLRGAHALGRADVLAEFHGVTRSQVTYGQLAGIARRNARAKALGAAHTVTGRAANVAALARLLRHEYRVTLGHMIAALDAQRAATVKAKAERLHARQ